MPRSKSRALISEINVVPYVDVMLVLLVIFMIATPLMTQGVVVNLPDVEAAAVDVARDEPLILTVDSTNRFYLSVGGDAEQPLDEQTVLERVGAVVRRNAATPIYVRGDESATHGQVMHGFALLRRAGAKQAVLVVESPEP
ncbi:MAG TPA: ExbD/TolR family protein [Gammaproteobacteria bacterium]|nr:ExbD/TolR family protein [Gammaproteobacteria bacterium]